MKRKNILIIINIDQIKWVDWMGIEIRRAGFFHQLARMFEDDINRLERKKHYFVAQSCLIATKDATFGNDHF